MQVYRSLLMAFKLLGLNTPGKAVYKAVFYLIFYMNFIHEIKNEAKKSGIHHVKSGILSQFLHEIEILVKRCTLFETEMSILGHF